MCSIYVVLRLGTECSAKQETIAPWDGAHCRGCLFQSATEFLFTSVHVNVPPAPSKPADCIAPPMMLPLPRRLSLLLAAVVPVALCAGTDGPVTIDQSDIYQQQRTCAFSCFKQFGDAGYPIAQQIACPTFKVQNKCFCRPDLQQDAHNYVFSCISTNCANALDISVATKLYDDYCTSNGWIVTTTTQAPQPSETGALTITITVPPTVVVTATATVTVTAASTFERPPTGWVSLVALAITLAFSSRGW